MLKSTIVGYPRIGLQRELKFAVESYFKEKITEQDLEETAKELRKSYWLTQKELGVDIIPSNDFSFYDNLLDTAYLLNIIPNRYKELNLSKLENYFAMARGYQKDNSDVKALPMKKWFNTNYHYIAPELEEDAVLKINDDKPFKLYEEARSLGIDTKPIIIGPLTLMKLTTIKGNKTIENWADDLINVYKEIFIKFNHLGVKYLQIDEPILVTDLTQRDIEVFNKIYKSLLGEKYDYKIILQTYFGDIRDIYKDVMKLDFHGYGLDFIEGKKNIELIEKYGLPKDKMIFCGVVNGKNIWRNNYSKTIDIINKIKSIVEEDKIVISTSCSLLHVPYTVKNEPLEIQYKETLAFANEKLNELKELKLLLNGKEHLSKRSFVENQRIINSKLTNPICFNREVREIPFYS